MGNSSLGWWILVNHSSHPMWAREELKKSVQLTEWENGIAGCYGLVLLGQAKAPICSGRRIGPLSIRSGTVKNLCLSYAPSYERIQAFYSCRMELPIIHLLEKRLNLAMAWFRKASWVAATNWHTRRIYLWVSSSRKNAIDLESTSTTFWAALFRLYQRLFFNIQNSIQCKTIY